MLKNYFLFLSLLFIFSPTLDAMQFKLSSESMPMRVLDHGLGSLGIGVINPKNNFGQNGTNFMTLLIGLNSLLKDSAKNLVFKLMVPMFGASLVAVQTRDTNRSVIDHLRALFAGGLITSGLWEAAKNLYLKNAKELLVGLGLCATGVLLLSQKDIKTFLGRRSGNSLNPPSDLKAYINRNPKCSEIEFKILRIIMECAQEGQKQAMPFFYRITSFIVDKVREENTDLKEKSLFISKKDLVTKILPYLRTDVEFTKMDSEEGPFTVFSVDPKSTSWMRKELIYPYTTLTAYKLAGG